MANIDLVAVGKRITELRKQKHLTQERLAELMDVSIQMVSNLERGLKAIRIDNLVKLSSILEISTDYLLTGKHLKGDSSAFEQKLMNLSDKDRKMIEMLIDYCVEK